METDPTPDLGQPAMIGAAAAVCCVGSWVECCGKKKSYQNSGEGSLFAVANKIKEIEGNRKERKTMDGIWGKGLVFIEWNNKEDNTDCLMLIWAWLERRKGSGED